MRILQVFEASTGGLPVHVELLTEQLLERGHQVDVALSRHGDLGPRFEQLGARVVPIDLVPELFALRANVRALRELLAVARAARYDIIHCHGAKGGVLGRLSGRLTGTPSAYTPHTLVYRTQHLRERRGQAPRRALTRGIEQVMGRIGDVVVCVSEDEHRAAVQDRIAPADRLRVVYYGIPLDGVAEPDPALVELREDGPLFGFMARLSDQKGLPLLIDALRALHERGTLPRFTIIGNGPLQDWLDRRLAEEGLAEAVDVRRFAPPVGPKLAAFDVYVLPSYWEALPIGVLEAMAAARPVISTTVNGIPEAVDDGRSGLLVAPDDPAALAGAIERLAADAELRARMGAVGRRRIEGRFTLARMADSIEEIYRDLVRR